MNCNISRVSVTQPSHRLPLSAELSTATSPPPTVASAGPSHNSSCKLKKHKRAHSISQKLFPNISDPPHVAPANNVGSFILVDSPLAPAHAHCQVVHPDTDLLIPQPISRVFKQLVRGFVRSSLKLLKRAPTSERLPSGINVRYSTYIDGQRVAPYTGRQQPVAEERDNANHHSASLSSPTEVGILTSSPTEEHEVEVPEDVGHSPISKPDGEAAGHGNVRDTDILNIPHDFVTHILEHPATGSAYSGWPAALGPTTEEDHNSASGKGTHYADNAHSPVRLIGVSRDVSPWTVLGVVGEGGHGRVYMVKHTSKVGPLAMKVISLQTRLHPTFYGCMADELKTLERLSEQDLPFVLCPITVESKWAWTSPRGFLHILSPLCPGGDLFGYRGEIRGGGNEQLMKCIAAELVLGIQSLHELGIVHHDIKPENIVVDAEGHCRITDFGGAMFVPRTGKFSQSTSDNSCISLPYAAPEALAVYRGQGKEYTKAIDWWSLGATLLYLIVGEDILHVGGRHGKLKSFEMCVEDIYYTMKKLRYSKRCVELILKLLQFDPEQRADIEEIKSDPFFNFHASRARQRCCGLSEYHEPRSWECIASKNHIKATPFQPRQICKVVTGRDAAEGDYNRFRAPWTEIAEEGAEGCFMRSMAENGFTLVEDDSFDPFLVQQMVEASD
ncbi:kinase-like domain-containing protein [Cytidiella melzeri]|nr:kinase-like domain-containing protein [Cytidiella melzeri]